MQADAEEIIILPKSGLALACFKRRAQVSDPKLGTPIIKSSSLPLLLPGQWIFLSKEEYAGLGVRDACKCMHSRFYALFM